MRFVKRIDHTKVSDERSIPLNITVGNKTVYLQEVYYLGTPDPMRDDFTKSGWMDGKDLGYNLEINENHKALRNVVVTDTHKGNGIRVKEGSFFILKGPYVAKNGEWDLSKMVNVTHQYPVQWNAERTEFTVHLGDINEGVYIAYKFELTYEGTEGEVFENKAKMTADNISPIEYTEAITYYTAGGSAEGYVFEIKLNKKDEAGQGLKGAKFQLTRDANGEVVAEGLTDEHGVLEFKDLLRADYTLTELAAPEGFLLKDTPIKIAGKDLSVDKPLEITAINKRPVTVKVSKVWKDGDNKEAKHPQSVKVMLLADGEKTGQTLILSEDKHWSDSFTDLEEYKDGIKIDYTVKEEAVEGYSVAISGDVKTGFVLTNTKMPEKTIASSTQTSETPTEKTTTVSTQTSETSTEKTTAQSSDPSKKTEPSTNPLPRTGEASDASLFASAFLLLSVLLILIKKRMNKS